MRDLVKKLVRNFWVANTGLSVPRKGDGLALIIGFLGMFYIFSDTLQWVYSMKPEQLQSASLLAIVTATVAILIIGQLVHLWYRPTNQDNIQKIYALLIGCIVALPMVWIVLSYMTQYP